MEKEKCCEKCERHIFGYPDYGNWCKNKDCPLPSNRALSTIAV
jgi:hypothetical protein